MGRRAKKKHYMGLPDKLRKYADVRALEFKQYSAYHMRLIYPDAVCLDVWTTAKYYVKETNYADMSDNKRIERGGESGMLKLNKLEQFLDDLFYAPFKEGVDV